MELSEKFRFSVMALGALTALIVPACSSEPPLTLPTAQEPILVPMAVSPCPNDTAGVPGPGPVSCHSGSPTGFPVKTLDLRWGQVCLQPCLWPCFLLFLTRSWLWLITSPAWDYKQVLSPSPVQPCLGAAELHPVHDGPAGSCGRPRCPARPPSWSSPALATPEHSFLLKNLLLYINLNLTGTMD